MKTIHIAFPMVPATLGAKEKAFVDTLYNSVAQNGHRAGFGVQQLARSVHLSRTQLNRKLAQILGYSALDLIMEYRFHEARRLLSKTNMPVKEIAARCGFSRHGAFCRSFTARFRCSPSHFRNTHKPNHNDTSLRWKIPLAEKDALLLQQLVSEKKWLGLLFTRVLTHISDELFSTEELASAAGVTVHVLTQQVKQLFNVTPQRLVRDIRLQYACELLSHKKETISGIAYQTGFFDPSHFSRCFKMVVGCRPSDYKGLYGIDSLSQLKKNGMHQNGK